MKRNIFDTVIKLNKILSYNDITYALGASLCLYFHGIDLTPHDIDIMVGVDDFPRLENLFKDFKKIDIPKSDVFLSKHFAKYEFEGIQIDVICEFIIKKEGLVYEYPFDKSKIIYIDYKGNKLPISPISDWKYLYSLMPNREAKVKMIEEWEKSKKN